MRGQVQEGEVTTDFNQRSRLESEQKRLTEQLEQLKASVRQAGEGKPLDTEEKATESVELDKCLALQKRIIDQLAEVEHALAKFEKGTYGLCDNCGQPIDPARLKALPQANLCLSCKTHLEEKKAKFPQARG